MFALQHRLHVLIVLQVVANNEGWPVRAKSLTPNRLTGAVGLDRDSIAQLNAVAAPNLSPTAALWIVGRQLRVVSQLALDVLQVGTSLVLRIGNDPDVRLPAFDGGPQHVNQRADGRLRASPRPDDIQLRAAGVTHRFQLLGQPAVHGRRLATKILRQVIASPIEQRMPGLADGAATPGHVRLQA